MQEPDTIFARRLRLEARYDGLLPRHEGCIAAHSAPVVLPVVSALARRRLRLSADGVEKDPALARISRYLDEMVKRARAGRSR